MKKTAKMELIFWMLTAFSGISFVMFMIMATTAGLGIAANAGYAGVAAGGFFAAMLFSGGCAFWAACEMPKED